MKHCGKDVMVRAVIGLLALTGAHAGSFASSSSFSSSSGGLVTSVASNGAGSMVSTVTSPDGTVIGECTFKDHEGHRRRLTYKIDRHGKQTVTDAPGVQHPPQELARCLRVVGDARDSYRRGFQNTNEALHNIFSNFQKHQSQFKKQQHEFEKQAGKFSSMMENISRMIKQQRNLQSRLLRRFSLLQPLG